MVQDNKKFRISLNMAEYLKLSPSTAPSKKLLLALIYLQHLEQEGWPSYDWEKQLPFMAFRTSGGSTND